LAGIQIRDSRLNDGKLMIDGTNFNDTDATESESEFTIADVSSNSMNHVRAGPEAVVILGHL
jgi:hypothetical protein